MQSVRTEIGRRKRARTRAALIEAAMRVFARVGPDAPTIDDFIAEAGCARGTFYNYFQTRDELLLAVAGEISDQLLSGMPERRGLPDPADRVACAVRGFVRMAANDPVRGWVVVRIALVAAPLGATMRNDLAADVQAGVAAGRFQVPSTQAAVDLILGVGLMGMRSVLRGDADATHAEDVAQIILTALGVDAAAEISRRPMDPEAVAARAAQQPPKPGRTSTPSRPGGKPARARTTSRKGATPC